MIDAIAGIASLTPDPELGQPSRIQGGDFEALVGEGLKTLNTDLSASDQVLRSFAAGEDIPLHDVMIVTERAQLSLQFAVELRNRVVEAYQQLTQMQL